jgi:hypothetical protein
MLRTVCRAAALVLAPSLVAVCGGGHEPAHVRLAVMTRAAAFAPFATDTGYAVELTEMRVAVADLEFTVNGEAHARSRRSVPGSLASVAYAHPGHLADGEVTGQLLGELVLDLAPTEDTVVGLAELLPGDYQGMNLRFRQARAEEPGLSDDPLAGHTVVVAGTATRGPDVFPFRAVIDLDAASTLVGAPAELSVGAATAGALVVELLAVEPTRTGGTLLDGVDFAAIGADSEGVTVIAAGDPAHDLIAGRVEDHSYWWVELRPGA